MFGILRKVYPLINCSSYLTIYYSVIFPYINYCNNVWAATYPLFLTKLLVIQRFLRMMSCSDKRHPSALLFIKFLFICFRHACWLNCRQDLPDTFNNFCFLQIVTRIQLDKKKKRFPFAYLSYIKT